MKLLTENNVRVCVILSTLLVVNRKPCRVVLRSGDIGGLGLPIQRSLLAWESDNWRYDSNILMHLWKTSCSQQARTVIKSERSLELSDADGMPVIAPIVFPGTRNTSRTRKHGVPADDSAVCHCPPGQVLLQ